MATGERGAGGRSRRATPDRILVAAMAEFGTRGYEATSLDDLARVLGIRKQTILYWYPSKEALLEAVVDRTQYDMNWNMPLPSGGNALANDVTLTVDVSLVARTEA